MRFLTEYTGSLISCKGTLISPYDYDAHYKNISGERFGILDVPSILNYSLRPFSLDYKGINSVCVINGMGVTLGDSIVGISALNAIKLINKDIKISIVRPQFSAGVVNQIYSMAPFVIDEIITMPCQLSALTCFDVLIDVGNQLHWPDFHRIEMHDFFIRNIGLSANSVSDEIKSNKWLYEYNSNSRVIVKDYVLFNPNASTPLRSIPQHVHYDLLDHIYSVHGVNIIGFSNIEHPKYRDVSFLSDTTEKYVNLVLNARHLYSCDSAALHIAAANSVPTTCYFNSIAPCLRSLYYSKCESLYMGCDLTKYLHESESQELIDIIGGNYEVYVSSLHYPNASIDFDGKYLL